MSVVAPVRAMLALAGLILVASPVRLPAPAPAPHRADTPPAAPRSTVPTPAPPGTPEGRHPGPFGSAPLAMWVWQRPDPTTLVAFATSHHVRQIFLAVPNHANDPRQMPDLARLCALATRAGIRVDALGGDPGWLDHPTIALAWQRDALATHLFTGTHIDFEPWAIPAWDTDRAQTVRRYLAVLAALRAASTKPMEVDVPFWLGQIGAGQGRTAADQVLATADAVTAMTYRNHVTGVNGVRDISADLLRRGAAAHRPVRLALETNPTLDCAHCSLSGTSASAVSETAAEIAAVEAGQPAFAGIAVEDYRGWASLRP